MMRDQVLVEPSSSIESAERSGGGAKSIDVSPVFIVSTGRAGSQMIANALARHPRLCALHEPPPHLNAEAFVSWSRRGNLPSWRTRLISHRRDALESTTRRKRELMIRQIIGNGYVYVESSHFLSHLIPELSSAFGGRFVHLYRDGRHFVRSGLQRDWFTKTTLSQDLVAWIRRRYLVELGRTSKDHLLSPPPEFRTRFEKIAWLWVEINTVILDGLESIPDGRKFALPVEALSAGTLEGLLGFIGVSSDAPTVEAMLEVASRKPNRTPGNPTQPPPDSWSDRERQRFNEIAGRMMVRLGYTT